MRLLSLLTTDYLLLTIYFLLLTNRSDPKCQASEEMCDRLEWRVISDGPNSSGAAGFWEGWVTLTRRPTEQTESVNYLLLTNTTCSFCSK